MLQLKLSGQYRYILCSFHWFIWKIVYFFLSQVTGKKKNSCQVTVCSLVFVSSQQRFGMTIPYGPTLPYLHNKEFWILFKKYGYCVYIGLKKKKNYLFMTVLGLHCCTGFPWVVVSGGHSLVVVHGLIIVVASLVAEQRLSSMWASVVAVRGLSSCSS